jgi:hypothetical protein
MKGGLITEHQLFPETFLQLFLHAATKAVTSIVVSWFQLLKELQSVRSHVQTRMHNLPDGRLGQLQLRTCSARRLLWTALKHLPDPLH